MVDLLNLYCIFSRRDGTYARNFKFGDSNKIIDINSDGNDNERFWCQSGDSNRSRVYAEKGRVTAPPSIAESLFVLKDHFN